MNEHKNIITIEDEIKEFSDKPVKSSVLYKKVKELESNAVPDASEASVGDVLTKGESGIGWETPSGGGGMPEGYPYEETTIIDASYEFYDNGAQLSNHALPESIEVIYATIDSTEYTLNRVFNDGVSWQNTPQGTIAVYNDGENYCGMWGENITDGTHNIKLTANQINETFTEAVEAISPPSTIPEAPNNMQSNYIYGLYNNHGAANWIGAVAPYASNMQEDAFYGAVRGSGQSPEAIRVIDFQNAVSSPQGTVFALEQRASGSQKRAGILPLSPVRVAKVPDIANDAYAGNGTYTLKATKSGDTVTYTWVLDS